MNTRIRSETCPHCFNEMVELRRFDPRDDRFGASDGGFDASDLVSDGLGDLIMGVLRGAKALIDFLFGWIGASIKARKLERIRRDYPSSLYCVRCGFTLKRR